MIEKIRAVNNPLNIIAIFAALAEVASTVALGLVDKNLQTTFVWFVMMFPSILVLLFFLTLNFNPKVLYAPSDFQNEENFLNILSGRKQLVDTIDKLNTQLEMTKNQLLESTSRQRERKGFEQLVNKEFLVLRNQLMHAKESAEDIVSQTSYEALPYSEFQARILSILNNSQKPLSASEISAAIKRDLNATNKVLEKLLKRRAIIRSDSDSGTVYSRTAA
jgi:hypothetical protein